MSEEATRFIPGVESEEQFDSVLNLLAGWINAGAVEIDIDSDGDIQFTLPDELNELMSTQLPKGLVYEQVQGIVKSEIEALLAAGQSNNPGRFIKRFVPDEVLERNPRLESRIEKAQQTLMTPILTDRVLLRKATTGFVLDDLSCKMMTYHIDSGNAGKRDIPCVSIEFSFVKPDSTPIYLVRSRGKSLGISRGDNMSVVLEMHKEDLKQLIEKLEQMFEKLAE
ncbi:MAG: hypothetical protein JW828_13700 [Sedimentisphaerales bacterium]|nr:hypothetical protein [Sedimentisphaerales bacterium]